MSTEIRTYLDPGIHKRREIATALGMIQFLRKDGLTDEEGQDIAEAEEEINTYRSIVRGSRTDGSMNKVPDEGQQP